jgi:peptidoglycan/xylan/chitin deacetylase (PgdA/CDA1 family)
VDNSRFPYWPIVERPPIRWPNDARIALWTMPNIEHFRLDNEGPRSGGGGLDARVFGHKDYGPRVGVWRMMEVLDNHSLRATVALNADVCRFYPQIIAAGNERRWEWMGHGITNSVRLNGMSEEQEREAIRQTLDTIEQHAGQRPAGWLGPGLVETLATPDLLAEAGVTYLCDWPNDDQPFPVRVRQGRLLMVPPTVELADLGLFEHHGTTPEQYYRLVCDHFEVLYEEASTSGKLFGLPLHPYVIGQPGASRWLDKALAYVTSFPDVWKTTGGEIADWYYTHYFEAAPT